MLSLQLPWGRGARWLALACVAGAVLAVAATGSSPAGAASTAHTAQDRNPACPARSVCLYSDKDWGGKRKVYFCDPGDRGTRTWDLVNDFPPGLPGQGKGVTSYVARATGSLDGGRTVLRDGPHNIFRSNDQATQLSILCPAPARDQACDGSIGLGFHCGLASGAASRRVTVTFDRSNRGQVTLTRAAGGATTAKLCDAAPKDGHPGPFIRVDTGRIQEFAGANGGCRRYRIPAQVRKFRVWWTSRSTQWVAGP